MPVEKHDIVQITDETHHWFPALLVVDEVKHDKILAFTLVPQKRGEEVGMGFIFLAHGRYEKVGHCAIIRPRGDKQ